MIPEKRFDWKRINNKRAQKGGVLQVDQLLDFFFLCSLTKFPVGPPGRRKKQQTEI